MSQINIFDEIIVDNFAGGGAEDLRPWRTSRTLWQFRRKYD